MAPPLLIVGSECATQYRVYGKHLEIACECGNPLNACRFTNAGNRVFDAPVSRNAFKRPKLLCVEVIRDGKWQSRNAAGWLPAPKGNQVLRIGKRKRPQQ